MLAKYSITFREILKRTVLVEADSMEEAVKKVHDSVDAISYEGCELVSDECWEE